MDKEEVQLDDQLEYLDLQSQFHFQIVTQDGTIVFGKLTEEVTQAEMRVSYAVTRVPSKYLGDDGHFYTPAQLEVFSVISLPGNIVRGVFGESGQDFEVVEWKEVDRQEIREETGRKRTIERPAKGQPLFWVLHTGKAELTGEVLTDDEGGWRIELLEAARLVYEDLDLYEEGKIVLQPGGGGRTSTFRVDFVELARSGG